MTTNWQFLSHHHRNPTPRLLRHKSQRPKHPATRNHDRLVLSFAGTFVIITVIDSVPGLDVLDINKQVSYHRAADLSLLIAGDRIADIAL
jgi:hypothetical protein